MKINLMSEFDDLQCVIMHRPGNEIDRLTPQNRHQYLFEEIPFLDDMQIEHDNFTSHIRSTGIKVLYLQDLLMQTLKIKDISYKFLNSQLKYNGFEYCADYILDTYSSHETAEILISGLKVKEVKDKIKDKIRGESEEFLLDPLPNMYFMRDAAAVVHNGIIFSNMKHKARQRETDILSFILKNHPDFKNEFSPIFPNENIPDENKLSLNIEGGDVIVLSDKALAIGHSERTDSESIKEVAKEMLKNDDFDRVYEVILPKERNYMHLDTVFTIIDENLIITYPHALESLQQTKIYTKESVDHFGNINLNCETINDSFINILDKEIKSLEIIHVGNSEPECSSREQWYDGANVFALGPRKVISYNRNKCTNNSLRDAGVEVIEIRGSELVRGLGGPRCMTMPIYRQ